MSYHFVFVHGASHGGWCWFKVRSLLENKGHKVSCVDLAGAGINPSDANTILTFDAYNKPLIDFMSALSEDEKVILVGHSFGGMNVTDAMNKFVNKVVVAIYVNAAMLPSFGELAASLPFQGPHKANWSDFLEMYEIWFGLGPDKPPTSILLKKEYQRQLLYNLSPVEDSTLAAMLLRPMPVMAQGIPNFGVGDGVDKVKRVCIRGTSDTFFSDASFESQIKMWPPTEIFTVESDHCPFFSAPTQLFHLLLRAMIDPF
ncbi:methylesterase 17-like isoform X2 [Magnolia sinica]|uniref:methylesterase 17-like isoform X2 n=1 Tax=Magnolia sinica TaxID=86752 RepID=UPI002657BD5A|nr:methylesterase 17-like isoform X2 [Magnolia sinica]